MSTIMTVFNILVNDHDIQLSPICKRQIDPTGLNHIHPLKHIYNSSGNTQLCSLFLDKAQRDLIIDKIATNPTLISIIESLIKQSGGDLRLFIEVDVTLLFPDVAQQPAFLSYNEVTKNHEKGTMTWIGLCLDFESNEQSSTTLVANLHTIFPLEPKNRSSNDITNESVSVEVLTNSFRTKHFFDIHGIEDKERKEFVPEPAKHEIFPRSWLLRHEAELSSQIISSLGTLPFSPCTLPNLNFYQSKVDACFADLSDTINCTTLDNQLSELGITDTDRQPIITQLTLFNEQPLTKSSDLTNLLKTLTKAQDVAQELISSIHQVVENALVRRHFPAVSDDELKSAFESIINELKKKDNKSIGIVLGGKEFCIDIDNAASRKEKLAKFTNCLQLMDNSGLQFDPFKSAKTVLGRYQIIDGDKLYAHPKLRKVIEVVKSKKTLIENSIVAIKELTKTIDDFYQIEKLLKENETIQKRQFESPRKELREIKERISSFTEFDTNLIDQLKRHIEQNGSTYEVTRKVDIQVGILCTQLRTRFLGKLIDLLTNAIREKDSSIFLNDINRNAVQFFFITENDALKLDKALIVNRITTSTSGLYESIMFARELIWELTQLLRRRVIAEKFEPLIQELAKAIQDIQKVRTAYPYAFQFGFTSSNSKHPIRENIRDVLTMAIDSLLNRIDIEEKYTYVLKSHLPGKSSSSNETPTFTTTIQEQRLLITKTLTPGRDRYISLVGFINFLDELKTWISSNSAQVALSIGPFFKPPIPSSYTTPRSELILVK